MAEVDKVERAAMNGERMPDGLDILDQLRFHGLSYIYHNYRKGVVDKATASSYKQSLLKELKYIKDDYDFAIRCWDSACKVYQRTEAARNAYSLSRTLENADAVIRALDGLGARGGA